MDIQYVGKYYPSSFYVYFVYYTLMFLSRFQVYLVYLEPDLICYICGRFTTVKQKQSITPISAVKPSIKTSRGHRRQSVSLVWKKEEHDIRASSGMKGTNKPFR